MLVFGPLCRTACSPYGVSTYFRGCAACSHQATYSALALPRFIGRFRRSWLSAVDDFRRFCPVFLGLAGYTIRCYGLSARLTAGLFHQLQILKGQ